MFHLRSSLSFSSDVRGGGGGHRANTSHLWRNKACPRIIWRLSIFVLTASLVVAALGREGGQQPATIPEMWGAWCARCHAQDGTGKIAEPTVKVQPMDFTDCKLTTAEPDADWERAIAKGGPGVGLSPQMPAFEDSLSAEQVSAFVSHIRGFCKERGWPSGNNNFPRPIVTEKAFPENEFLILPAISHDKEVEIVGLYEMRLGKRSMFEVAVPAVSVPGDPRAGGIGDLEVSLKHTIFARAQTPRIVSLGLDAVIPSGNDEKGLGHGTAFFEPFISAGAMLGNWYLQTQVKVELPVDPDKAERAFVYNGYLGRDTSMAPNTWTLGVELNGENHEVSLTPQVRKGLTGTGALAMSIGAMVPINEREERGVRWVGYLLWEFLEPLRA